MPEPDRLEELRRQRAKLEAELAKLEGELTDAATPRPAASQRRQAASAPRFRPVTMDPATEELFEKLSADEKAQAPSKTGCWFAFAVLLLGATGAVALAMRLIYHR